MARYAATQQARVEVHAEPMQTSANRESEGLYASGIAQVRKRTVDPRNFARIAHDPPLE